MRGNSGESGRETVYCVSGYVVLIGGMLSRNLEVGAFMEDAYMGS
jgi:hypothetical protein